jgi:hypothetical protein
MNNIPEIIRETARVILAGTKTPQEIIDNPYEVIDTSLDLEVILFKNHLSPLITKFSYDMLKAEGDEWAMRNDADVASPSQIKNAKYTGEEFIVLPKEQRTNKTLIRMIKDKTVENQNCWITTTSMQPAFWYITPTSPESISTFM